MSKRTYQEVERAAVSQFIESCCRLVEPGSFVYEYYSRDVEPGIPIKAEWVMRVADDYMLYRSDVYDTFLAYCTVASTYNWPMFQLERFVELVLGQSERIKLVDRGEIDPETYKDIRKSYPHIGMEFFGLRLSRPSVKFHKEAGVIKVFNNLQQ